MVNPPNFWKSHLKSSKCPGDKRGRYSGKVCHTPGCGIWDHTICSSAAQALPCILANVLLQVVSSFSVQGLLLFAGSEASTVGSMGCTSSLTKHMTTPAQNEAFVEHSVMACITGCIPFAFMENPHMVPAAKAASVTLPSRKVLATTLDSVFDKVKPPSSEKMCTLLHIDASSDGWSKKYCEQGASLANFCHLTSNGALLHDVVQWSALRKDSTGIVTILETAVEQLSGGELGRIFGWLLDNTKAN